MLASSKYTPSATASRAKGYLCKCENGYSFHFNGKESDDEAKGEGNQQDYGMRIYDNRLCKFLSVDPLTSKYPELTPFQFASNRPIDGIDLDGEEWKSKHKWTDKITDKAHIKLLGDKYVSGMTYIDAWNLMAPEILNNSIGRKIDCADLAIDALVEFAYKFKLSIYFEDYKIGKDKDPTFDNDNYGFTDKKGKKITFKEGEWKRLANNIKAYYGAGDIFKNEKIAKDKSLGKVEPGDIIAWKHAGNQGYHTQTISSVFHSDYWFDSYETIQGNLDKNNQAQPARKTEYRMRDILDRPGETIKGREWNFTGFDKKGKK